MQVRMGFHLHEGKHPEIPLKGWTFRVCSRLNCEAFRGEKDNITINAPIHDCLKYAELNTGFHFENKICTKWYSDSIDN